MKLSKYVRKCWVNNYLLCVIQMVKKNPTIWNWLFSPHLFYILKSTRGSDSLIPPDSTALSAVSL